MKLIFNMFGKLIENKKKVLHLLKYSSRGIINNVNYVRIAGKRAADHYFIII